MRFHLGSFIAGLVVYWGIQHFTGFGNTGKGSKG
jgi:hypothetical protein